MELCKLFILCAFTFEYILCYDFRLPNDTVPVSYDLKITPYFGDNIFEATINITINVVAPTHQIVLHARNLTIHEEDIQITSLFYLAPGTVNVASTDVDKANAFFIINTEDELDVQLYAIIINFSGIIQEEMSGFSVASYSNNGSKSYIGLTHFEPTHARSVFPCYDEPRYRTNFSLQVTVPNTYSVISNVPVSGKTPINNVSQSFYFRDYKQMPTYLLAWVIYDHQTYYNVSSVVSGITINTWARQGLLDQTTYANANSGTLLTTIWSYLNTPFGGLKIDQVTVPNFFIGAKENWGLITYAEESLLYKSGISTTRNQQSIILAVSHELTHQWFGDLVTVESWSFPWLKEAFAQYFQYIITASVQPSWQLADQIVVNLLQPALELDSTPQHALSNYSISSEKDISTMFDDITYNKGAAIIRMLHTVFGEDAFRLGMQIHFWSSSKSGVTNPKSLWNNLRVAANSKKVNLGGESLDKIMTGWTDAPGYPVLSVVKTESGAYNITQKRFLYTGLINSSWWIPLTFTLQETKDNVTTVFLPGNIVLVLNITNSGWILFNVNQTGFYRVNYDEDNWNLLSNQLQSDLKKIPRINRAQLLDDLFNFARGGFEQYTKVFSFTKFLYNEIDYIPWVTAIRNFNFLLKKFYLQPVHTLLKEYILSLMESVISDVGFQETASEGHLQKLKRILVLETACSLGHAGCISNAAQLLKNWKNGIVSKSADIQSALVCAAVENGDSKDWDFIFSQYLSSTMPTLKASLLNSLTCSQNTTKLNEFLDSIMTNRSMVSNKDLMAAIKSLASKPHGAVILLDYLLNRDYCSNNSLSMLSDYEEEVLGSVFEQITPQLSTLKDFQKLEAYAINGTCLSNHSSQYIQSLATKGYNTILWQQQYNSTIYNWLLQQKSVLTTNTPLTTTSTIKPPINGQSQLTIQYLNIILCVISFIYIIY